MLVVLTGILPFFIADEYCAMRAVRVAAASGRAISVLWSRRHRFSSDLLSRVLGGGLEQTESKWLLRSSELVMVAINLFTSNS